MSKTALITGASKGIGYEIVKKLWFENSEYKKFVLIARESIEFKNLLSELNEKNPHNNKYSYYYVDLSIRENAKEVVERIYKENITIELIVNNAGYTKPEPIQQIKMDDWDLTLNVNLISPFILIQELLKRGNVLELIINIASTAGINGRAGWLTYSASKAAMINMSEVLREELKIYGTRVICLTPGRCATSLRRTLAPDEDPSTIMQPVDVAEVVYMLTTSVGKFIDNQYIVVKL